MSPISDSCGVSPSRWRWIGPVFPCSYLIWLLAACRSSICFILVVIFRLVNLARSSVNLTCSFKVLRVEA